MKILITGGAGFIGSHLVRALLKNNNEVVCIDNFDEYYDSSIKRKNIESFVRNNNFKLIEGDINNEKLIKDALIDVDYLFHEAAQAGVRISVDYPEKAHTVNATGTLNLLKAAMDSNVKKIISASSSSVYGSVEYLPFDENHPTNPVSPYGVSKLMAEHYCRVFSELYGLKTISLRYFTVYGPHMRPDLAINIFTKAALQNEPINIFGDGTKTRDFTYIDDIINANIIAMKKGEGSYNIGAGNSITINELAEKIIDVNGSESKIIYSNAIKGDAEHTLASIEKAKEGLGWVPRIKIDDGLKRYSRWMSDNGVI